MVDKEIVFGVSGPIEGWRGRNGNFLQTELEGRHGGERTSGV